MLRSRTVKAVSFVIIVVGSMAGCSTDGDTERDPKRMKTTDGLTLLVAGDSDGSDDARVQGMITDVGGCVGITRDTAKYAVVWPAGTKVGDDDALLALPNGDEVGDGDEIVAGGGYYSEPYPDRVPEVPDACRSDQIVVVGDVEVR